MSAQGEGHRRGYDRLKDFGGVKYSGMKVGGTHKWYYDQGTWKERKLASDEWEIFYQTPKRRAGHAPEQSGVPVGTSYNWLIVAHQRVDKLDANSYMTYLDGKKFKVAHKRASKDKWNIKEATQRKKVIEFLERVIHDLKEADEDEPVPYSVGEGERIYGLNLKTREELYEIAARDDIPDRSKMKREDLLTAVKALHHGDGAAYREGVEHGDGRVAEADGRAPTSEKLLDQTRTELYRLAQDRHIPGRSEMNKRELAQALSRSNGSIR